VSALESPRPAELLLPLPVERGGLHVPVPLPLPLLARPVILK